MKLTTVTMISVDGVLQGLGAPDEDRRDGFDRGGWAAAPFGDEEMTFLGGIYQRADAFLFGRWTYDVFADSWGTMEDPTGHPVGEALNTRPKYLVSDTVGEPRWGDTTVLSGDLATHIRALKADPPGELQVHGSGRLVRWLWENQLIDEITLLTVPVILGQGTRLFPSPGPDSALELVDSQVTSHGITIQVYRPAGPPKYTTARIHEDD